MNTIQGIARFKIHPGKLGDFKRLAAKCMELARAKDTGTLRYEQFFNEEETECIVHEEYVDSEACMQHFKNMGDTAEKILATAEVRGEMWGTPSADLRTAVESKGVNLYAPFLSLEK